MQFSAILTRTKANPRVTDYSEQIPQQEKYGDIMMTTLLGSKLTRIINAKDKQHTNIVAKKVKKKITKLHNIFTIIT
ncbi:MAG: hypothetical protein Q8765_02540, partial [Sweet potato little leaf phytoplasma]|nr:hypothetical protein [Sweet potato little leaf phytoplasma]